MCCQFDNWNQLPIMKYKVKTMYIKMLMEADFCFQEDGVDVIFPMLLNFIYNAKVCVLTNIHPMLYIHQGSSSNLKYS